MSFLDKKEQILEICLTKHGRKLLSKGKLNIKYYAFADDEVDYQVSSFSQVEVSPGSLLLAENESVLLTEGGDSIIVE